MREQIVWGVNVMEVEIREEPVGSLSEHAEVPIAFLVDRVLEVSIPADGLGGIALQERPLTAPYVKDYDAINGEGPTRWPRTFDVTNWGLIAAHGGSRIGGAVVAFKTANLDMLDGRSDLAMLWDLRVRPDVRGRGVGSLLFRGVEEWARNRGCTQLKVETQNVNVPACHFYARMGCTLGRIDRFAYEELPEETQLLWYKEL
ncbi:MAG TPA: GNAT family N-acetyltransferase [Acidimicrobiales bacterium]|nr:GNAT family N-acetyltransferase [Acidimicrobiales bacterium]